MLVTNFIDTQFLTERKNAMIQPPSSKAANDKMNETGTKITHADAIYNIMLSMPNRMATATQIALKACFDYTEANRRMSELLAAKRIEIFSEKGGKTATGNSCRIYRALVTSEQKPEPVAEQTTLF